MAFARSVIPKPVRLGTHTPYYETGARPEEVRQLYQANRESQTPWIAASSDEVRESCERAGLKSWVLFEAVVI